MPRRGATAEALLERRRRRAATAPAPTAPRGQSGKQARRRRYDNDIYTDRTKDSEVERLPENLLDALREFDKDEELKNMLGSEFSNAFIKLKNQEWRKFFSHLTTWEKDNTLDI